MIQLIVLVFVLALIGVGMARSTFDSGKRKALAARLAAEHGLDRLYVSRQDLSFVGLSLSQGLVVVGRDEEAIARRLDAIAGMTLEADGTTVATAHVGSLADTPDISPRSTLAINLQFHGEETKHEVVFLAWARGKAPKAVAGPARDEAWAVWRDLTAALAPTA